MEKFAIIIEEFGKGKVSVVECKCLNDALDVADDYISNMSNCIVLSLKEARLIANDILLHKEV
jgi:hypothetical protein